MKIHRRPFPPSNSPLWGELRGAAVCDFFRLAFNRETGIFYGSTTMQEGSQ